jgi:hypothetical protein
MSNVPKYGQPGFPEFLAEMNAVLEQARRRRPARPLGEEVKRLRCFEDLHPCAANCGTLLQEGKFCQECLKKKGTAKG